jgi:hypothetical protein
VTFKNTNPVLYKKEKCKEKKKTHKKTSRQPGMNPIGQFLKSGKSEKEKKEINIKRKDKKERKI